MTTEVSLLSLIQERIAGGQVTLPPFSKVALKLQSVAARKDFDLKEVLQLIHADQALTAEVLRAANSTFFSGLAEITTVQQATVRLGVLEVVRLAIAATEKGKYSLRDPELDRFTPALWRHAMGCALGAQWLARKLSYPDLENEAFIAGLLHDVGKLLVMKVLEQIRAEEDDAPPMPQQLIGELLASCHAAEGYRLAQEWQLPAQYGEIMRAHHDESVDQSDTLMLLVRLANRACNGLGIGLVADRSVALAASEEAYLLGMREIQLAELQIMLEDAKTLEM